MVWPTDEHPGPSYRWDDFFAETSDERDEPPLDVCEGGPPRHLAPVVLQLRQWVAAWQDGRVPQDEYYDGLTRFVRHAVEHAEAAAALTADPSAPGPHLFEQIRALAIESYDRFADAVTALQKDATSPDTWRVLEETAHTLHVLESTVATGRESSSHA